MREIFSVLGHASEPSQIAPTFRVQQTVQNDVSVIFQMYEQRISRKAFIRETSLERQNKRAFFKYSASEYFDSLGMTFPCNFCKAFHFAKKSVVSSSLSRSKFFTCRIYGAFFQSSWQQPPTTLLSLFAE